MIKSLLELFYRYGIGLFIGGYKALGILICLIVIFACYSSIQDDADFNRRLVRAVEGKAIVVDKTREQRGSGSKKYTVNVISIKYGNNYNAKISGDYKIGDVIPICYDYEQPSYIFGISYTRIEKRDSAAAYILIALSLLFLIAGLHHYFSSSSTGRTESTRTSSTTSTYSPSTRYQQSDSTNSTETKQRQDTYRPATQKKSNNISFTNKADSPKNSSLDLSDIKDAFTGAPINLALGVYQCINCTVYYHRSSYEVLREINSSQCVACKSTQIVSLTNAQAKSSHGSNYNPDVITLQNYRQHVGRVITFEGHVHTVLTSRRGKDYAVMFEKASWTKGFKLIFQRAAVKEVGAQYIFSLIGKTITVRGLLINHPVFGYEIVVSERSMILRIS